MRNLLVGAFVLYAAELFANNWGLPVYDLAWHPLGRGFQAWQPVTRFLVQGPNVTGVLFGLLLVYFLLPALWELVGHDRLRRAALAGVVGATLAPLLLDLVVADHGTVMGWTTVAWVLLPTIFGLALPEQTVYLMFFLPVNGRALLWFTAVICALLLLFGAGSAIGSAEPIGAWLGCYGWWQTLGPGGRRRDLERKGRAIEAELRKFTVIEGGRSGPRNGNRPAPDDDPDEWVH